MCSQRRPGLREFSRTGLGLRNTLEAPAGEAVRVLVSAAQPIEIRVRFRVPHTSAVGIRLAQVRGLIPAWAGLCLTACGIASVPARSAHVPAPSPVSTAQSRVEEPSALPPVATPAIVAPPTSAFPTSSASLPVGLQGTEWISLPTRRRIVALTFDAGSGAEGVSSILSTLSREKVPGTFFLTGRWVQAHPDQARRVGAVVGHSIGNHTYDHVGMPWLSGLAASLEVTNAESIIREASGRDPRPLFRFPYGASDPRTIHIVNGLAYGSIRWTVDTEGWRGTSNGQSVGSAVSRVVNALGPGEIVLMHVGAAPDGSTIDADSLPRVIQEVRSRGYGFVAVWDFIHGNS